MLTFNSTIFRAKTKFFIYKLLFYLLFFLIPTAIKYIRAPYQGWTMVLIFFSIIFMTTQWYLLGKEIDYRLKIYYRVNSSLERILYRLLLGMMSLLILYNVVFFLFPHFIKSFYWILWVILAFFYSWPTRGKIIEDTISKNLTEYKFLDSFEKTTLLILFIFFVFSLPAPPKLESLEALILYLDPNELIAPTFWNFIAINYIPFSRAESLAPLITYFHLYYFFVSIFLMAFYVLLRLFLSRRSSILAIFALVSSWSYSQILNENMGLFLFTFFPIIWIWSFFWGSRSATYRSGLFIGLLGLLGTLIHPNYFFLLIIEVVLILVFGFEDKTPWFKKQFLRYALFGTVLAFIFYIGNLGPKFFVSHYLYSHDLKSFMLNFSHIFRRKAFFILAPLGFFFLILSFFRMQHLIPESLLRFHSLKFKEFLVLLSAIFLFSFINNQNTVYYFNLLWLLSFFAILPVEMIFQKIGRLRSNKNLVYMSYVMICLLDSHFEGRIKIFLGIFRRFFSHLAI